MEFFDFIFHIDETLGSMISFAGPWIYVILFAIIFAETGLVVTPFLPGDSLIFAVGMFAANEFLSLWLVYVVMVLAAIIGDSVNYWIGHHIGLRVFAKKDSKIFKKSYLEKTHAFYEKHGGKTIILARFVPIVRTFAPFVAGVGKMRYKAFLFYNITGAFIWITLFILAGYFFGGLPLIKENFEYTIIGIIILSLMPMFVEYIKHKRSSGTAQKDSLKTTHKDIQKVFEKEQLID